MSHPHLAHLQHDNKIIACVLLTHFTACISIHKQTHAHPHRETRMITRLHPQTTDKHSKALNASADNARYCRSTHHCTHCSIHFILVYKYNFIVILIYVGIMCHLLG